MKLKVIIGILTLGAVVASVGYGVPNNQARTVLQGVYTNEQADRGMQVVENYGCRRCHGGELEGGAEEEPPLVGEQFVAAWSGHKLDELAEKITTMPADQPPAYQVQKPNSPDVVAYLLRINGYPAGRAELPTDSSALRQIEIVAP